MHVSYGSSWKMDILLHMFFDRTPPSAHKRQAYIIKNSPCSLQVKSSSENSPCRRMQLQYYATSTGLTKKLPRLRFAHYFVCPIFCVIPFIFLTSTSSIHFNKRLYHSSEVKFISSEKIFGGVNLLFCINFLCVGNYNVLIL